MENRSKVLKILNNYKQALNIIMEEGCALEFFLTSFSIMKNQLDEWQEAQATYFEMLSKELAEGVYKIAYIELLQEYRAAE